MKVSWSWLEEFFDPGALGDTTPEEAARRLTLQGIAVDEVRPAFPEFEGVVLGRVLAVAPHPDADKLSLCTVAAGDGERSVVCGAPNIEVGAIYGFAAPGARLPGDRTIARAEIRGVTSEGMLCSAPELGLDALGSAEGIWKVSGAREADLGHDLREVLDLDDLVLDLDLTSNRADAFSHLGIARELGWIVGHRCRPPTSGLAESGAPAAERTSVAIEDPAGCPLYLARLVEGVTVGPSPAWLQARLLAAGMRPVNNVVDATNYVMLELGQPLHAFDFEHLAGGRIVVRAAEAGERFTTLDHIERRLEAGTTMICDAERPVAIGGVMGGLDSEVTGGTTRLLLESAHFDPDRISATARRLGIVSEAATRFARGVDPHRAGPALDRLAALIVDLAGGTVADGRVGAGSPPAPRTDSIELRIGRLNALAGLSVDPERARASLEAVGFGIETSADERLAVRVPSWRFDVTREVDLIEEVARLVGYDAIPLEPLPAPPVAAAPTDEERGVDRVQAAARAAGYDEARTPSFVGDHVLGPATPIDSMLEIRNPISKADRFLRPFVFATLGAAVTYNLKRGASRVKLFETGHAFRLDADGSVEERSRLALVAAGRRAPLHWSRVDPPGFDVFDLLGDVAEIAWQSARLRPEPAPVEHAWLHPGRRASLVGADGARIGFLGELHPGVGAAWGADRRLYVAELDLGALIAPMPAPAFRPFHESPSVERDLALVVPDGTSAGRVIERVREAALEHLRRVDVFDRYAGRQLPEGHHSLGLRLEFRGERTLTDEEVDHEVERLVERLDQDHGWQRR